MTELPPQGPQFRKDERDDGDESETPVEQVVESGD